MYKAQSLPVKPVLGSCCSCVHAAVLSVILKSSAAIVLAACSLASQLASNVDLNSLLTTPIVGMSKALLL